MRSRSIVIFLAIVVLLVGTGYLFTLPNPFTGDPVAGRLRLGLDLQGGTHVVLEAQGTEQREVSEEDMQKVLGIIRFRVDKLGVSEPVIQRQGDRRLIVELAGVKDPEQAVDLIGRTALLEFKDEGDEVVLTGADLVQAQAEISPTNQIIVRLELEPAARKRFADATTENLNKPIFIYLDDELVQAPIVQAPGIEEPEITGYASLEEAQRVAVLLNSGALPVPLEIIENRLISATLGRDSIERSQVAGLIAAAAVVLFMLVFYRVPGVVANLALAIYLLLLVGALIGLKAVLTLPGIAGMILSLGMAVDANVIIFERVKEEIRNGKTLRSSVESGFLQAFRTILDANVTTLIGAVVLFYFGAGPIRGFAVTLSLGIIISMFTAMVICRYLLRLVVEVGLVKSTRAFLRA